MKFMFLMLLGVLAAISASAQTFTTVASFNGSGNGDGPQGPLVQGLDGNLYGAAGSGGGSTNCQKPGCGTIFKLTLEGALTVVHTFDSLDGHNPNGGLVLATNGNFYGTTEQGEKTTWDGSVFEVSPTGTFSTLVSFDGTNGGVPLPLVEGTNGNFYGTERGGPDYGSVFETTPSGTLTTLYVFGKGSEKDPGEYPFGGLVQANDGNFYGTTSGGGTNSDGTVFRITPGGTLTTIYNFCSKKDCVDGIGPYDSLVLGTDGNLYGTTNYGGAHTSTICSGNACGTVFKITTAGELTTLYSFCPEANCDDGAAPEVGLVQATDGNFYGTTNAGGTYGYGTIFQISPSGKFTTVHSFESDDRSYSPLMQATDGTLYGATGSGGTSNDGTVYSLSVGLKPFVKTVPTAGDIGQKVYILGSDLSGAKSVSFNGTATEFDIVSPTEITATVPKGATTGTVKVTTPSGTLLSNVVFRIL